MGVSGASPDLAYATLPQIRAGSVNFLKPGRAVRSCIGLQKHTPALLSPAGGTGSQATALFGVCTRVE